MSIFVQLLAHVHFDGLACYAVIALDEPTTPIIAAYAHAPTYWSAMRGFHGSLAAYVARHVRLPVMCENCGVLTLLVLVHAERVVQAPRGDRTVIVQDVDVPASEVRLRCTLLLAIHAGRLCICLLLSV